MTSVYYNELDQSAAAWLRELMAADLIPAGEIDTRSIEDVTPNDVRGYDQCHFFAGIGGWAYAFRLAGLGDDFRCWTGSAPCQPFSSAGQGAGFDDKRHLWPAFYHLIRECKPPVVFGEQVASKTADPWIDLVCADLEAVGYAFGCVPFPAAGLGAPHIRDRNYWVGDASGSGLEKRVGLARIPGGATGRDARKAVIGTGARTDRMAEWCPQCGCGSDRFGFAHAPLCPRRRSADDDRLADANGAGPFARQPSATAAGHGRTAVANGGSVGMADTQHPERRALDLDREDGRDGANGGRQETHGEPGTRGQVRGMADPDIRTGGQGRALDRGRDSRGDAQPRAGLGSSGDTRSEWPSPLHGFWRDADWLFCRDGKWRPVEPGTFPLVAGLPSGVVPSSYQGMAIDANRSAEARVMRLKGYGNSIVPQQAAAFIRAYMSARAHRAVAA